jgi:hypothetical protein
VFGGSVQAETKRPDDLKNRGEFRIAFGRQRLVKALAPETRFAGNLRHPLGAGDVSQSGRHQRRVAADIDTSSRTRFILPTKFLVEFLFPERRSPESYLSSWGTSNKISFFL